MPGALQPVVSFTLGSDWTCVTRTIVAVFAQPGTFANIGGVVPSTSNNA